MKLVRQFISQCHLPAQLWGADSTVLVTNTRFNELFGLPLDFDWAEHDLHMCNDPQFITHGTADLLKRAFQGAPVEIHSVNYDPYKNPHSRKTRGEALQLFLRIVPLFNEHGEVECVACLVSDYASGESRYEHELMRSQKMENIETLASGVAHEFNNIFTGIKGMTDLIKDEVDQSSEIWEFAYTIQQNISRGAVLIQKLSTFARELPYAMRRVKISDYISQVLPLLQLQVQRRIHIETELNADGEVLLDPNRMDQALANVALNAKDAMAGQGMLRIRTDSQAPEQALRSEKYADTDWIMIEIADSGPGIPEEVLHRVLEPFFSTKERGKATGLGLSVTNRIVLSHNGVLEVGRSSDLGGAALRLFLPFAPLDESASI